MCIFPTGWPQETIFHLAVKRRSDGQITKTLSGAFITISYSSVRHDEAQPAGSRATLLQYRVAVIMWKTNLERTFVGGPRASQNDADSNLPD